MIFTGRHASAFLLVCTVTACSGGGSVTVSTAPSPTTSRTSPTATPDGTASRTATPVDPKQPLSDSEILWLAHLLRDAQKFQDEAVTDSSTIDSPATMRREADAARGCSRIPSGTSEPGPRLAPVHDLLVKACRRYDRAARCADRAAELMGTPVEAGSSEDREFSESLDCWSAECSKGSALLADVVEKGLDISEKAGYL